jgi:hypothetical protein
LLFDCIINVLGIYSSGLSILNKFKFKMTEDTLDLFEEKSDEELHTQKAEELGVSLEYYLMEFV